VTKRTSTGFDPLLGGNRAARANGREPSLSRDWIDSYGRFLVPGLEAPPVSGRRRPLVVHAEFDESTAELIALLAESNGYDVRCAPDGPTAVNLIRALEPNLVAVSLRLPVFDGFQVIRQVRADADPLIASSPILVMDERQGERFILEAFRSGADDYLELPYEVPVLLRGWRRVAGYLHRPTPLTALTNPDGLTREVALSYLLEERPAGLEDGLGELLWQPDPTVRSTVRDALWRLGTSEARAVLARATHSHD
jgi:CheY-like chemotaxis protein